MIGDHDGQPIATYNDEPSSMVRDAAGCLIFGERQNCGWYEFIDGELYKAEGLVSIAWITAPVKWWDHVSE